MANVNDILRQVYGFRGLPFPAKIEGQETSPIAGDFTARDASEAAPDRSDDGTPYWSTNVLGRPVFMPVKLGGYELPNPLISFTGENSIIETDVTEIGTVFEKVFQRPYDITIICTLINAEGTFPENELRQVKKLFHEGVLYTLQCALTDIFLQPKNNFILRSIDVMDMQGVENAQVVQLTGRSNKDFELELKQNGLAR